MKDRIKNFLATAESPQTRDVKELKALYVEIGNAELKCESDTCINKMLTAVRKYYYLHFEAAGKPVKARKYILKDGNHSFAPGETQCHNNDNVTDAQIAWYLKHYPHVKQLLIDQQ